MLGYKKDTTGLEAMMLGCQSYAEQHIKSGLKKTPMDIDAIEIPDSHDGEDYGEEEEQINKYDF